MSDNQQRLLKISAFGPVLYLDLFDDKDNPLIIEDILWISSGNRGWNTL